MHGAMAHEPVAFRRKVHRDGVLDHLAASPRCVVAMEGCAGGHYWEREIEKLGHDAKLVPPIYVKPLVKHQENDSADPEAICDAAQGPTMRFVTVTSEEQQATGMLFRTRDLLVRQRTQTINALRGHLAEFGVIAPQGPAQVTRLAGALEEVGPGLPELVRKLDLVLLKQIYGFGEQITAVDKDLGREVRDDEAAAYEHAR